MNVIKNIAIITARGGSKRIPRKNIKNFMGKPMISYAINAAKKSKIFDEIMVSTDDLEIANLSKKLGANVPFMRSAKNSDDFATTMDVIKEVFNEYKKRNYKIEDICCIYPCVPLLDGKILKDAYKIFKEKKCDKLTPVVKFSFPIERAFKIDENGYLSYKEPQNALKRSQDLQSFFHDAGMFYFYKSNALDSLYETPFILSEKSVQDIDTIEDWNMAEIKYRINNNL